MDIMPILATLKRHKTASGLIVLQIALTCAIVCNALFLIMQRLDRINEDSGIADRELIALHVTSIGPAANAIAQTHADLQALAALPGVKSATLINQMPFGENMSMSTMRRVESEKGGVTAAMYNASENWLQTLGVRLVAGRDFEPGEYQNSLDLEKQDEPKYPAIILNRAFAQRMFPGQEAVGRVLYGMGKGFVRVVGVIDTLVSPQPGGKDDMLRNAMVLPVRDSFRGGNFLLRTEPAQREALLKAATKALDKSGPNRILTQQTTLEELRAKYYRQDRSMVMLLAGVCMALLIVTAFGIVGLASFWVQQRTRMIGTRRALGATQSQILRYFQTENFLLSTVGIVLGMIAAYAISLALMKSYELPPLPLTFLPLGAVVLWGLGQLAVLAPARRAAGLAPVAALRAG